MEARASAFVESTLGYHPWTIEALTLCHELGSGQCQAGSLTGAVASQRVTEARDGELRLVGTQLTSAMA